ncbi:hypothetical protein [Brevifollis gellanilyticus]|uniref:Uncharacterized protein n=1 Tax=Brevifollis gellanilyticus TaxID=748831 RepID=A0A512MD28_9BACT|nr:hypothetical protein [Brevifollis gellanilyticus]GEP44612.1 hypothetical protein BGE01nite_39030 [Brevifollis gellanilyticus]
MPKLTIDLPDSVMPYLTQKAEGWKQTPEGFLSSYVVHALEHEEESEHEYADPSQKALEDILEERMKGPFVPVPEDLVDQVMEKAMERVRQRQAHV